MGRPDFLTISHSPYKPLYIHTHTCSFTWSFIESVSGATWHFSVICITKLISPYWSHLVVNEPWDFEHTSYPIPIPQFSCFLFPDFKARFKDAGKMYSSDLKKGFCCFAPHSLSSIVYSQGKTVAVTLKSSRNFLHFVQYFGLKRNRGYLLKKSYSFFAICCLYPYVKMT